MLQLTLMSENKNKKKLFEAVNADDATGVREAIKQVRV